MSGRIGDTISVSRAASFESVIEAQPMTRFVHCNRAITTGWATRESVPFDEDGIEAESYIWGEDERNRGDTKQALFVDRQPEVPQ